MSNIDNRQKMQELVKHYHGSNKDQITFADANGISAGKLHYWIKKLSPKKEKPIVGGSSDKFIPIEIAPSSGGSPKHILIRTSDGIEIEVPV